MYKLSIYVIVLAGNILRGASIDSYYFGAVSEHARIYPAAVFPLTKLGFPPNREIRFYVCLIYHTSSLLRFAPCAGFLQPTVWKHTRSHATTPRPRAPRPRAITPEIPLSRLY